MRKIGIILSIIALPILLFLTAYKSGSPGGYSGSPGDSGKSCTNCHSGTAIMVDGWISTNVPATGYKAGEVYIITITTTNVNAARFGFEISAEDANNKKIASFNITNASETKLTNSNRAVTHTSSGTTPSGNMKSWNFEWTAPQENTGTITLNAAINAANGNGSSSGDNIYLTSTSITSSSTGIREYMPSFKFYPNPASGMVNFQTDFNFVVTDLFIYSLNGKLIDKIPLAKGLSQINLSYLPKGIYYLNLSGKDKEESQILILY